MKVIKLTACFLGLLILSACEKDKLGVRSDLLTGNWRLEQVSFNGIDGVEMEGWWGYDIALYFGEDQKYYRNYVSGTWSLQKSRLSMTGNPDLGVDDLEFKILEVTEAKLVMQTNLTDVNYCCDLEMFADDEVVRITETFIRLN